MTTRELDKSYDAKAVEKKWYAKWEEAGVFKADAADSLGKKPKKEPYVIMMPPPNVTGVLHNGHALFVTLQDTLIRYHRMLGKNALWLPGVDHAGIATQAVVERELKKKEGLSRHDLGREKFLERIWDWKQKHGDRIVEQLKLLGASPDWDKLRFTMDEQCTTSVKHAFVKLWEDGLIFRGERLINWDPVTLTALSNEEVDHEDRQGELYQFAYKLKNKPEQEIIVATTRPETMLGDTAVAVNPKDARYKDLVGEVLEHPFCSDRYLVVIADDYVKEDFGTGAVKITPAHDPNDFDMGKRHDLPVVNIFTQDAKVNGVCEQFEGLDRFAARKAIKFALVEKGLDRGSEKIKHAVSISSRSGEVVEPRLSRQYFLRAGPLAQGAYQAVETGETKIIPASWKKTWDHFLLNIQDWCISRQLWWGHRIPVFYDTEKLIEILNTSQLPLEAKAALDRKEPISKVLRMALDEMDEDAIRAISTASTEDLTLQSSKYLQEDDVLDTWFSAGLWPFSTLGWPEQTDNLKAFYPGAVLETGFDILFFWVARMMMMGTYFMGKAPFKDIYLHAMVRDSHGQKMSKSLGNAIDPIDVISGITKQDLLAKTKTYPVPEKLLPKILKGLEKDYPDGIPAAGADGLRLSLTMLSGQGRDVKLDLSRVEGYRSFLNKIWNATRFALMRIGEGDIKPISKVSKDFSSFDTWILSRLNKTIQSVRHNLDTYQFSQAAQSIYQFFWTDFCDWYIELSKPTLFEESMSPEKEANRAVLVHVLEESMRLLHPFCPFISEEIWQILPKTKDQSSELCASANYPEADDKLINDGIESEIADMQRVISMIRNARQESNLPVQKKVDCILLGSDKNQTDFLERYKKPISALAYLQSFEAGEFGTLELPKLSATNSMGGFTVVIPLEGLIDVKVEKARLSQEIAKSEKELQGTQGRLNNESFVKRAPKEVVEQCQKRVLELQEKVEHLKNAWARLG